MHELSLIQNLVKLVKEQIPDEPVSGITIEVGMLSCVQPTTLQMCFDVVKAQDEQLKHCTLSILETFPVARCSRCANQFTLNKLGEACRCGAYDYAIDGGDELTLKQLEY